MSNLMISGKSPKMWVNEICVKQLVRPKWDTQDALPGRTPPSFICRCTITYSDRTLDAEGTGKTKKDAEQEAARDMLTKLEMTPAKLEAINNAAKKKEVFSSNSHSSSKTDSKVNVTEAETDNVDDISDTDEAELNAAMNPIGDLMAICDSNELEDPEYEEIKVEGPSHKRVFTMGCTVKELNISLSGRRPKKQLAKKLAALRVLREVKNKGYKYVAFDEQSNNEHETIPDNLSAEDIQSRLEKLEISNGTEVGVQGHCSGSTEKCLKYLVNYNHAFHHLKKSEALDQLMKTPYSLDQSDDDDFFTALEKITTELEIPLTIFEPEMFGSYTVHISMAFPFDFDTKIPIPNSSVLFGQGDTIKEAKNNAAREGLRFLLLMMQK